MTDENSVQAFYKGKEIFLTGGSGFVGKFVIEKLLRSCPDLRKIYVLMRGKKSLGINERLEILKNDKVNSVNWNFYSVVNSKCSLGF